MKYFVDVDGERIEVVVEGDVVSAGGASLSAHLEAVEGTPIRLLTIGDVVHRVVVRREEGKGRYTLSMDGWRFAVEALDERTRAIRDLAGAAAPPTGPVPLRAPMPGLIVRVLVKPGDTVKAGQGMIVMEAMKMENELRATAPGTVATVPVAPGTAVEKGVVLVELT